MARWWHSVAYALGAATAACAFVNGCSLITSFDGYGGRDAEAADPSCPNRKLIPERPPATSKANEKTYVGAAATIDFVKTKKDPSVQGGTAYNPIPGFDLDEKCTVRDDTASSPCTPRGASVVPDDPGTGGDNGIGALLAQVLPSGIFFQSQSDGGVEGFVTDGIARGTHGLVVRVKSYNGLQDDDDVQVELFNTVGVNGKSDGTGVAKFDGNDVFIFDGSNSPGGTDVPASSDAHGFVRGGVLTATFEEFSLQLRGTIVRDGGTSDLTVAVPLKRAYLIGAIKITANLGLEMTNGTLTGRMPIDRLFTEVENFGVCLPPGASDDGVRQFVCQAADIGLTDDRRGKCDALSFAYSVSIKPAKLGTAGSRAPAPPICATHRPPCPE